MKKKSRYMIVVCIFAVLFLLTACPHTTSNESNNNSHPSKENPDDTPEWHGGFASDQFWWGTWQRMDNGDLYEIGEETVKIYKNGNKNPSETYTISDTSTEESLDVTSFGIFTKTSDRIIELNNIPYFRKGGSNLDFSLKLVGFINDRHAASGRAASSVSNLRVKIKDKNHPSYVDETESDEDGIVKGKAPVAGDEMSLSIQKENGGEVVVSGMKVEFSGADVGTIPLVEENQHALKVTGVIKDEDKTDGYLYADFTDYPLTLTITNISDVECPPSMYKIYSADDNLLIIPADSQYALEGRLPTIPKDGSLTVKVKVRCTGMTTTSLNTGIRVKVNATDGTEWNDYVPLKFYRGLFPINVSAVTNAKNESAVLNAFVIYPDNNTKFFIVDQSKTGRTIFVPSFDERESYKLVFCGANSTKALSDSTEMFYTVAPGSITPRVVAVPDEMNEYTQIVNFGESGNKNDTEETAYTVNESFEAYIHGGDKDFYEFSVSDSLLISADRVPLEYWNNSITGVEPIEDTNAVYNAYTMVYKGTFASANSWVIYCFKTNPGETYKVEWGDKDDVLSANYEGETLTWNDGTANIAVAYNTTSEQFISERFYHQTPQTITGARGSEYAYIKVKPYNSLGGSYCLRVTNSSSVGQKLYCEKSSGYVADSWQQDYFKTGEEEHTYYNYLSKDYDYTLRWSDYWEGFGQSADIEVSASTVPDDFSTSSKLYFSKVNNGYLEGQTIRVEKSCYVFFKFKPRSAYSRFEGSYAFNIIAKKSDETIFYTGTLNKYDIETFLCDSGSSVTNSNAWGSGLIYPGGYEILTLPVQAGQSYTVFWDDSSDGSGAKTADIEVSAYKNKELSNSYWISQDKGYAGENRHIIKADSDGLAYIKVSNKKADSSGDFRITALYGPDSVVPFSEYESHNCNYGYGVPDSIKESDWTKGTLSNADSQDVYYFPIESDKVYKLYGLDSDNSSSYTGKVQGAMLLCPLTEDDSEIWELGNSAVSFYNQISGVEYISVQPYEKKSSNTGTYSIIVLDGDNQPVHLTKYTMDRGEQLPDEAWVEDSLSSVDETIVYTFVSKPYTYTTLFWDDKGEGSRKYTADITVSIGSINEDDISPNSFDSGYTTEDNIYFITEVEQRYYVKIRVKGSSLNKGTFAIAVMEGNEISQSLSKVTPNNTISFENTADIQLSDSVSGKVHEYSVGSGYSVYRWYIEGVLQSENSNTLSLDTTNWNPGVYEIAVEVSDGKNFYSACKFLKVE